MKMKVIIPVLFASLLIIPASLFAQEVPDFVEYIDIGNSTLHVKIHEDLAYVTNPADGQIVVLSTTSNRIVNIFDVVQGVTFIEPVKSQNRIYASADGQPKIFVYDFTTGSKITEINFPAEEITLFSKSDKPYDKREYVSFQTSGISLAHNPNNDLLYAVHSEANHVDVIDTRTDTIIEKIPVGTNPLLIEIDVNRNVGYVTNGQSNDVTVINLHKNEVIRSIQTGLVPDQMVLDIENRRLFVTHHESPHLAVIDLRDQTLEDKIQLKGPTNAIGIDSKNKLLHVTYTPESGVTGMASTHIVEVIDTSTLQHVAYFEIISNPFTMDIDSDEKKTVCNNN